MNKLNLIKIFQNENKLTRSEAESAVNIFFDKMSDSLASGDRVEIRGLCSFYVKKYKAYTGRNPKTAEKISVPQKKLPFFKCGKELKERVDCKNTEGTNPSESKLINRRKGKDRRQRNETILAPDRRKTENRRKQ